MPQTWLFFHSAFLVWQRVSLEKGNTLQRRVHIHTPVLVFYARMSFSSAVTALECVPGAVSNVMLCIWPFLPIQVLFQTHLQRFGSRAGSAVHTVQLWNPAGAQAGCTSVHDPAHPFPPTPSLTPAPNGKVTPLHFLPVSFCRSKFHLSVWSLLPLPPHAFASPPRCPGLTQCPPHISICINQRMCLYFDSVRCKSTELSVN